MPATNKIEDTAKETAKAAENATKSAANNTASAANTAARSANDAAKTGSDNVKKIADAAARSAERASSETTAAVRDMTERSVKQAKNAYDQMHETAAEASELLEDSYATATKGMTAYGKKSLEAARTNANATFDLINALMAAKTLSEVVEIQTKHARKFYETVTAQTKELTSMARDVAAETGKPYQALAQKAMKFPKEAARK